MVRSVCLFSCPQAKAGRLRSEDEVEDEDAEVEVEVSRCVRGQYFGELALVTNKPRAASVYAVGETKCLGKTHRQFWLRSNTVFHPRMY